MKNLLIILFGLGAGLANAENMDLLFKQYVIQSNNLDKCLFPEIYRTNETDVLDVWWNDEDNGRMRRAYYLKLKMRLAQKIMPEELANRFNNGELPYSEEQSYEQAKQKYHKTVSVKRCENVSQYALNLIEERDEINDKWRKDFPEP